AVVQHAYGEMLLRRNAGGDRERAGQMLDRALATAREIGLARIVRRISELGAPAPLDAAPAGQGVFRREGEFWTVRFGEGTFRLKDTKGMRYVASLLARPGVEVHVMELVAAGERGSAASRGA